MLVKMGIISPRIEQKIIETTTYVIWYIVLEPFCPLFWVWTPPKEGPFPFKTRGPIWGPRYHAKHVPFRSLETKLQTQDFTWPVRCAAIHIAITTWRKLEHPKHGWNLVPPFLGPRNVSFREARFQGFGDLVILYLKKSESTDTYSKAI